MPLLAATVLALALANSPLAGPIEAALETRLGVSWTFVELSKPLLLWINDGLMAIFFLLVGLEIKRELIEGELSSPRQAALPAFRHLRWLRVAALGCGTLPRLEARARGRGAGVDRH